MTLLIVEVKLPHVPAMTAAFALGMIIPLAALIALMFGSPLIAWIIRRA